MNIIFNCFPPSNTQYPSLAFSILKAFITSQGHHADIKYWNILLDGMQKRFINATNDFNAEKDGMLLVINYIITKRSEKIQTSHLMSKLLSLFPQWNCLEGSFIKNRLKDYAEELDVFIHDEIDKMSLNQYALFGISSKFHQWLCGGIVAEKVKRLFPDLKIVIGGFGTKNEAMAIMKNFDFYDYAVWGEGEYPLLQLCHAIETSSSDKNIPFIVSRDAQNNLRLSESHNRKEFLDMNGGIIPDYSDFFTQTNHQHIVQIPIEKSRGCHWRKCHFCFLNDGYKYRVKSNVVMIKEIQQHIHNYNIKNFFFTDTDIVGNDYAEFERFLDGLIELKNQYNGFRIISAEVITFGIHYEIIKKMALAGFKGIQIGYESPSNKLLKKISKKNTFASNLLFIKCAQLFSISVAGANIITGLIEETSEDIMEAIDNLHYLRFFLKDEMFKHNFSTLHISTASPYFPIIQKQNDLSNWKKSDPMNLLPDNFIDKSDDYTLFLHYKNASYLWDYFKKVEEFYFLAKFSYDIIKYQGVIFYREYSKETQINEFTFDNTIHWKILSLCNHSVMSINDIQTKLPGTDYNVIVQSVKELNSERLLYANDELSELVSVINTDKIV